MHKPLEDYLVQVAQEIDSIPEPRRAEELKEMREHLVSAMVANQELGQSADTAVGNALKEFGTPAEAGTSVLVAWRGFPHKRSLRTFCTIVGIWSAFAAFQIVFISPSAADQHRWSWFLAGTVAVSGLLLVVPLYLPLRSRCLWLSSARWRP